MSETLIQAELRVIIVAYLKNGWVKCCFEDIKGELHSWNDQIGFITVKLDLNEDSEFPQIGYLQCTASNKNDGTSKIYTYIAIGSKKENTFEVHTTQLK